MVSLILKKNDYSISDLNTMKNSDFSDDFISDSLLKLIEFAVPYAKEKDSTVELITKNSDFTKDMINYFFITVASGLPS
jgi:hypothetical protein